MNNYLDKKNHRISDDSIGELLEKRLKNSSDYLKKAEKFKQNLVFLPEQKFTQNRESGSSKKSLSQSYVSVVSENLEVYEVPSKKNISKARGRNKENKKVAFMDMPIPDFFWHLLTATEIIDLTRDNFIVTFGKLLRQDTSGNSFDKDKGVVFYKRFNSESVYTFLTHNLRCSMTEPTLIWPSIIDFTTANFYKKELNNFYDDMLRKEMSKEDVIKFYNDFYVEKRRFISIMCFIYKRIKGAFFLAFIMMRILTFIGFFWTFSAL